MNKRKIWAVLAVGLSVLLTSPVRAMAEEPDLLSLYRQYEADFAAIEQIDDIEECNHTAIWNQSFLVQLESFGEEEVTVLPVMDNAYRRVAILVADADGHVLYKTNQLETNYTWLGQLEQPTRGIVSVSFRDLNWDGLKDIILITNCRNDTDVYAGKTYKVGDVLFQKDGSFYRDWRISDKINRFSMNKGVDSIVAYVRDGSSTEVLYTASTLDELLRSGFQVFEDQSYYRTFEKQGRLKVVPGIIQMAEYNVFMIYLVNEQNYIVWSFQPMGDYDNLYALKGMTCRDLDGDGMKDLLVLGRYSYAGTNGELLVDTKCHIYYQRMDGFVEDTEFQKTYQCTEEDKVSELVTRIREYWGWTTEE